MPKQDKPSEASQSSRYLVIDSWRGATIVLMIIYHACFDLNQFGFIHQAMNHSPFWLAARAIIVTSFLLLVGISLVLSNAQGGMRFWRRIVYISLCALLVSLASMLMFPQSYIFFGVLHCIVVASLIGYRLTPYPRLLLLLGVSIVMFGVGFAHPVFDTPYLQWLGLMTFKPMTEDYVPIFPWLGVVCLGMVLGHYLLKQPCFLQLAQQTKFSHPVLNWLGQKSLFIYMVHQPILMAILWLAVQIFRR